MNEYFIDEKYILNESDAEDKVILPLVKNPEPIGLGYNITQIQSKVNLQKLNIDKGNKSLLYFPDFVLIIDGIPLIVIEAKKPHEDLYEAFRQASLYAAEINRKFRQDLNPCKLIIASDGLKLLAGYYDNAAPVFDIEASDWTFTTEQFGLFINTFCQSTQNREAIAFKKRLRKDTAFKKPILLLGGKHIQNQSIINSFGESISAQYQHLFNPNVEEERSDIVKNAYVKILKHEAHVAPIDKLIRKKIRPAIKESLEISDNTEPEILLEKLRNAHSYNNQVLLLIGSVGSGKSTFVSYLKDVAVDPEVSSHLFWVRLDLNVAPVSKEEIYNWIKNKIIEAIQFSNAELDFNQLNVIEKVYKTRINNLKKGVLQLLSPTSDKYNELLVTEILKFQSDIDISLESYIDEFIYNENKELVIVLDNCDKRNLEEQLLMFEVANWIKDNIRALVFLPLRDTTFDHYRYEKPLDTVIKDLIFRINPPSLEKVIYSRIKYANRLATKNSERHYYLPNGFKVSYPATEELYYLKSILKSLFQNHFFKRLIAGLTGSDIRRGIEIFLDFCKSGHITDSEIFKIKQLKGEHILPNHVISRVFLRGNRLYYTDTQARIKNIFNSEASDELPDPFVRIAILKWLLDRYRQKGPSGIQGFHKAEDLYSDLLKLGHSQMRLEAETLNMLRLSLIISESQDANKLENNELISINTPGIIHVELLTSVDYLSSCAEDVWFNQVQIATEIAKNISGEGKYTHLSIQNSIRHSELLQSYLKEYFDKNFSAYSGYLSESAFIPPIDFSEIADSIVDVEQSIIYNTFKELKTGSVHKATIINIKAYGILCEIEQCPNIGLVHIGDIQDRDYEQNFRIGDELSVKIKEFKPEHGKYNLYIVDSEKQYNL